MGSNSTLNNRWEVTEDLQHNFMGRSEELFELNRYILEAFEDQSKRTKIVRLMGPAGSGKTRLVFESLRYSEENQIHARIIQGRCNQAKCIPLEGILSLVLNYLFVEGQSLKEQLNTSETIMIATVEATDREEIKRIFEIIRDLTLDERRFEILDLVPEHLLVEEIYFAIFQFLKFANSLQPTIAILKDINFADIFTLDFIQKYFSRLSKEQFLFISEESGNIIFPFPLVKQEIIQISYLSDEDVNLFVNLRMPNLVMPSVENDLKNFNVIKLILNHIRVFSMSLPSQLGSLDLVYELCYQQLKSELKELVTIVGICEGIASKNDLQRIIHLSNDSFDEFKFKTQLDFACELGYLTFNDDQFVQVSVPSLGQWLVASCSQERRKKIIDCYRENDMENNYRNISGQLYLDNLSLSEGGYGLQTYYHKAEIGPTNSNGLSLALAGKNLIEKAEDQNDDNFFKTMNNYIKNMLDLGQVILVYDEIEILMNIASTDLQKADAAFYNGYALRTKDLLVKAEREIEKSLEIYGNLNIVSHNRLRAQNLQIEFLMSQMNYRIAEIEGHKLLKLFENIPGFPSEKCQTLCLLGDVKIVLNRVKDALGIYELGLKLALDKFGKNHHNSATAMMKMASGHFHLNDYSSALRYGKQALYIFERILGSDNIRIAEVENDIGFFAENSSKFDEAQKWYIKSRKNKIRVLGKNHKQVAIADVNIGSLACIDGQYNRSIDYLIDAISILEKSLGDHILTANAHFNLGTVFLCQCRYQEALKSIRMAISMSIRLDLVEQSDHGHFLSGLAKAQLQLGNYDIAQENFTIALAIFDRHLGKDHASSVVAVKGLAALAAIRGDFWLAKMHLQRVLDFNADTLTITSLVELYLDLGKIYRDLEEKKHAENYCEQAMVYAESLREGHPLYGRVLLFKATIHLEYGRFHEALQAVQYGMKIFSQTFEGNHSLFGNAYLILGNIHTKLRDHGKALIEYNKSAKIFKNLMGEQSLDIAMLYKRIGLVQSQQSNFPQALSYISSSRAMLIRLFGSDHHLIGSLSKTLGILYQNKGDYHKAKAHQVDALAILSNTFGKMHQKLSQVYSSLGTCEMFLSNLELSEKYYLTALKIVHENFGETSDRLAYILLGLATNANYQNKHEKAIDFAKQSYKIFSQNFGNDNVILVYPVLEIGIAKSHLGHQNEGEFYLKQALNLAISKNSDLEAECYLKLGEFYKIFKDFPLAMDAFLRSKEVYQRLGLQNYVKEAEKEIQEIEQLSANK